MFDHSYWFDNLKRFVARKQEIINLNEVLWSDEWSRCLIGEEDSIIVLLDHNCEDSLFYESDLVFY